MKKHYFTLLVLLFTYYQGYGQNLDFSVRLKLSPQLDRSHRLTEYAGIEALTLKHDVIFEQTYPGARNPELLLYYTLTIRGGRSIGEFSRTESLESAEATRANVVRREGVIKDFLATGRFENSIYEYGITRINSCTNPVSVNDPDFQNAYGWPLRMINAPCAWAITRGNPNVLIGIVDTEFRATHEDLQNRFASIKGRVSQGNHHGTAVASVAAAGTNNGRGIAGIGYNSRISAYRVVHTNISELSAYVNVRDIESAIWNLHRLGVPIINVSMAVTGLSVAAAREITQNGTTLVLSGGNSTTSQAHSAIANIPGVIVVSSVDQNNRIGSTGHSRSRYIDIVAPGTNIRVAGGNNDTHYRQANGTSFAAPFVAGTIALMLSVNSTLTPAQIEEILKATAAPIADGHLLPGRGRLNAYIAVRTAGISGPSILCYIGTFSIDNLPAGATVTWSSPHLTCAGGNCTTPVVNGRSSITMTKRIDRRAYLQATVNLPNGTSMTFRRQVTAGRPVWPSISSTHHNVAPGFCPGNTLDERIKYQGEELFFGNPHHIIDAEWYPSAPLTPPGLSNIFFGTTVSHDFAGPFRRAVTINSFHNNHLAHAAVRLQNQCGWSDFRVFYYFRRDNCGGFGNLPCGCPPRNCTCLLPPIIVLSITYPNPVDDVLTIDLTQRETDAFEARTDVRASEVFNIRLLNAQGMIVRQQRTSVATIQFDVSNLPEGTYYLHIEHNGEIEKHQIIVQRN